MTLDAETAYQPLYRASHMASPQALYVALNEYENDSLFLRVSPGGLMVLMSCPRLAGLQEM